MIASEAGIAFSDLLDMDVREFNDFVDGYNKRRETQLNDNAQIGHLIAGKISEAVWGDSRFTRPIKPIKIVKDKQENSIEEYCKKQMLEFAKNWIVKE